MIKRFALSFFCFAIIVLGLIVFIGCGGGSSDGIPSLSEQTEFYYSTVADSLGTFRLISSNSGAVVESNEGNTLASGTSVVLVERLPKSNESKLYGGKSSNIYTLKAKYNNQNIIYLEKPVILTITNNFGKEYKRFFLAFKSETASEWQYFEIIDENNINYNLTKSTRIAVKESNLFKIKSYRLNYTFAIFAIKDGSDLENKMDTVIDIQFSANPSVLHFNKNSKYTSHILVSSCITANNSSALFAGSDVQSQLVFFNSNSSDLSGLKIDNLTPSQTSSTSKDTSNNNYSHILYIKSYKRNNIAISGNTATYTFELKLNGISTKDFPDNFRVKTILKDSKGVEFTSEGAIKLNSIVEPEETDTETSTSTTTNTSTNTQTSTDSSTNTSTQTNTDNTSNTDTNSNTGTDTNTSTNTATNSNTDTNTNTSTSSDTSTNTSTNSNTSTNTTTSTNSNTSTSTGTDTSVEVFEISYELNGGHFTTQNPDSYGVGSSTIILNNPTKEGYRFTGWTGSNGNTPQTVVIIEKGSTGNKTFVANYTSSSYVITYNLDGGTVTPANPTGYNTSSETFSISNPTKNGYNFIGWTSTEIAVPQMTVNIESGSTGDKEFTANYTPISYNIAYTLNDGILTSYNPLKYDITSSTIILNNPTKEGYSFIGWTSANILTPQVYMIIEKGSYGHKSFTANWSKNSYRVTLVKGTGIADVTGDGLHEYGSTVVASCTMLNGYDFDSWTGNFTESTFLMPAYDVVMQANTKLKTYSIICNLNGGSTTTPNPTSYKINYNNITLINPTKNYYDFIGWTGYNGNIPQTTVVIPQGSYGNREYTANYTPTKYNIVYTLNGGVEESSNPEYYDITSATINLINPVRNGYTFLGWTGSNGNLPQTAVSIPQGSFGDKSFTANWSLNLNLAIAPDDGMIIDGANNLYYTKSSFTVTPSFAAGIVLNNSEKANLLSSISIKDSDGQSVTGGNISTQWTNDDKIAISFNNDLNASTTYTISFDYVEGITLNYTPFTFKTFYYKGRGTNENRYQVETPAQLYLVRSYLDSHFVQTSDIDIGSYNWTAIGGYGSYFYGSYYGNGKVIKNLKFRNIDNDSSIVGLFGIVSNVNGSDIYIGKIASVTIDGVSIRGSDSNPDEPYKSYNSQHERVYTNIGIIVSRLYDEGIIENSKVTNSTNNSSQILVDGGCFGGICGYCDNPAYIKNCTVEKISYKDIGDYVFNYGDWGKIGGICGEGGNISNCSLSYSTIEVTGNRRCISGICYEANDLFQCSVNYSTIEGTNEAFYIYGIGKGRYIGCKISNCCVTNSTIRETGGNDGTGANCIYGIGDADGGIYQCYLFNTTIKGTSNTSISIDGIGGDSLQCYTASSTIEGVANNYCSILGIGGGNVCLSYVTNTSIKGIANRCLIEGIGGGNSTSQCYVSESILKAECNEFCYISGISSGGNIIQSYVLNTNLQLNSVNSDAYSNRIGGISSTNSGNINSCYFYYDKDNEFPLSSNINNNYTGLLLGY